MATFDFKPKISTTEGSVDIPAIQIGLVDNNTPVNKENEFYGRNGAQIDRAGEKAQHTIFTAIFSKDNYDDNQNLFDILKSASENNLPIEFTHPFDGPLNGAVGPYSRRFDRSERTAFITIDFVEELITDQPVVFEDVERITQGQVKTGLLEMISKWGEDISADLGLDGDSILSTVLDFGSDTLAQFSSITGSARFYLREINSGINTMEGTLSEIANPANSLIASIDYGTNLPGRAMKAIAQTAERYLTLNQSIENSPNRFMQSIRSGKNSLSTSLGLDFPEVGGTKSLSAKRSAQDALQKFTTGAFALISGQALGRIYTEDENIRRKVLTDERVKTFDDNGRLIKQVEIGDIFGENEIELSLKESRELIQEGIDLERGLQTPKDMARSLLDHAERIKLEKERVVTVTIEIPTPLHLLLNRFDLPYKADKRVAAINPNISNFSAVEGTFNYFAQ